MASKTASQLSGLVFASIMFASPVFANDCPIWVEVREIDVVDGRTLHVTETNGDEWVVTTRGNCPGLRRNNGIAFGPDGSRECMKPGDILHIGSGFICTIGEVTSAEQDGEGDDEQAATPDATNES